MDQFIDQAQLKSKEENLNLANKYSYSLPLYEHNIRKNAIKISKNKLPSDWFPRSDSSHKKINLAKISFHPIDHHLSNKNIQSENPFQSPQKTSFFNFFQEQPKKKNITQIKNTNRKLQTREIIKRSPNVEIRKYTASTNSHRPQFLDVCLSAYQAKINKINKNSKKQSEQIHYLLDNHFANPQKQQKQIKEQTSLTQRKNIIQINMKCNDPNNITFFNAKSTSLPPVKKYNKLEK